MNKTELVAEMVKVLESDYELKATKKETVAQVEAFVKVVTEAVVKGDEVSLAGFGKFTSVDVAERTGIIQMGDRKGETYTTPAHRAPKFKFASAFKEAVK